jgi:hypothetical protein
MGNSVRDIADPDAVEQARESLVTYMEGRRVQHRRTGRRGPVPSDCSCGRRNGTDAI